MAKWRGEIRRAWRYTQVVAVLMSLALPNMRTATVGAFPRRGLPSDSCGTTVTYRFTNPDDLTPWDAQEKTDVELGVEGWESTDDWDGTRIVTIYNPVGDTGEIKIWFERYSSGPPSMAPASAMRVTALQVTTSR